MIEQAGVFVILVVVFLFCLFKADFTFCALNRVVRVLAPVPIMPALVTIAVTLSDVLQMLFIAAGHHLGKDLRLWKVSSLSISIQTFNFLQFI